MLVPSLGLMLGALAFSGLIFEMFESDFVG